MGTKNNQVLGYPYTVYKFSTANFGISLKYFTEYPREFTIGFSKVKASTGNSKVMVLERREYGKIDFGKPCSIRRPSESQCRMKMNEVVLEVFMHLNI